MASGSLTSKWWFWLLVVLAIVLVIVIAVGLGVLVWYVFIRNSDDKLPRPNKIMTEVAAEYQDKPENGGFVNPPVSPFTNIRAADTYARFGYRAVKLPTGATNIAPANASDIRWQEKVYLIQLAADARDNRLTFKIPRPDPEEVKLLATDVRFQLVADYYSDSEGKGAKLNTTGVVVHDTITMDADGEEVTETDNTNSAVTTSSVNPSLVAP